MPVDSPPLPDVRCPLHRELTFQSYGLKGAEADPRGRWYHAPCGVLFTGLDPDPLTVFTEAYRQTLLDRKEIDLRYQHYVRCFAPLIEERTYLRRFLDIGYGTPHVLQAMDARGWLCTGIDLIRPAGEPDGELTLPSGMRLISANAETFDFGTARYDCIWMGSVLECLRDPAAMLRKVFTLLHPNGLLFLVTPEADLLRAGKLASFGHWNLDTHRMLLPGAVLRRLVETSSLTPQDGRFQVLYQAQNTSQRFPVWNTTHLLAQKEAYGT